jgi:hypothetical protein
MGQEPKGEGEGDQDERDEAVNQPEILESPNPGPLQRPQSETHTYTGQKGQGESMQQCQG